MDDAAAAGLAGGLEDDAGAVDVDGVDLLGSVERQRGGGVNDDVAALGGADDQGAVADVAAVLGDLGALRIVEGLAIEGDDLVAAGEQVADEVDPEEAGAAGDEPSHGRG